MTREAWGGPEAGGIARHDTPGSESVEPPDAREFQHQQIERAEVVAKIAGGVAHNLNNVLTVILGRVEMWLIEMESKRVQPARLRKGLLEIRKAALDAGEVLRRLRDLTRPAREASPAVFDLNSAVREAERLLQPHVLTVSQAKGITVRLRHRLAPTPALVSGRPSAVREILVNLVLNAMDAVGDLPDRRRAIHVIVAAHGRTGSFTVSDRGQGIAPEHLPRLFDSFFSTKQRGMGLGLSITRTIVAASTETAPRSCDG